MKAMFLAFLLPLALVVGCATNDLQKRADQARAGYAVVVSAFGAYASLPRCTPVQPVPCSQQSTVNTMRTVDNVLDAATKAAQSAPSTASVTKAESELAKAQALAAANPAR